MSTSTLTAPSSQSIAKITSVNCSTRSILGNPFVGKDAIQAFRRWLFEADKNPNQDSYNLAQRVITQYEGKDIQLSPRWRKPSCVDFLNRLNGCGDAVLSDEPHKAILVSYLNYKQNAN